MFIRAPLKIAACNFYFKTRLTKTVVKQFFAHSNIIHLFLLCSLIILARNKILFCKEYSKAGTEGNNFSFNSS